jgi:hypothetical protein
MAEELLGSMSESSVEGLSESSSAGMSASSNSSSDGRRSPPKEPNEKIVTKGDLRDIPPR